MESSILIRKIPPAQVIETMITLEEAVPCKICGEKPVLQGGERSGRLVCPNYKSKTLLHGNLNSNTNGLPMGFTNRCHYFWTEEQKEKEGIPTVVKEWNSMHQQQISVE